jgi:hypothetical protein
MGLLPLEESSTRPAGTAATMLMLSALLSAPDFVRTIA